MLFIRYCETRLFYRTARQNSGVPFLPWTGNVIGTVLVWGGGVNCCYSVYFDTTTNWKITGLAWRPFGCFGWVFWPSVGDIFRLLLGYWTTTTPCPGQVSVGCQCQLTETQVFKDVHWAFFFWWYDFSPLKDSNYRGKAWTFPLWFGLFVSVCWG